MRIKTIQRGEDEFTKELPTDIDKVQKNIDPSLHPFTRSREYVRAVNAVKLEKIFAKPFISALSGHSDSVFSLAKHPQRLSALLSGGADGEIRLWNLMESKTLWREKAHNGIVRGIAFLFSAVSDPSVSFLSCGDDKQIKLWSVNTEVLPEDDPVTMSLETEPTSVWLGEHPFTSIDRQRNSSRFAAAGNGVSIYDIHKSTAVKNLEWGTDSVTSIKFNEVETEVLAGTATDRSIILYDLRTATPLKKLVLQMKSNTLCWNPMEAFNFTVANEDNNLYTFDMRKLDKARNVHKDHISAVLDVDYSPTGREFCSGSYDKTIRIWNVSEGKSREVYHTKRMQRIYTVRFTADSKFVLSGSDDTNIRLWKANAAETLGVMLPRQKQSVDYMKTVKERYKHTAEISRIDKHRHLPKVIYKEKKLNQVMKGSKERKLKNKIKHSKPGSITVKPERKKHIVATLD